MSNTELLGTKDIAMPQFLSFVILLLLRSSPGASEAFRQGRWRKTFTTSLTIPGHQVALTASTVFKCGAGCLSTSGCRAFGFCPDQGRCLLYDHLVEYTTRGTAAPGTRYYWLLSPRCPTERNYTMAAGMCYRLYNVLVDLTTAHGVCEQDGGHLMIADTPEKLNLTEHASKWIYWVGATDLEIEGQWWWIDGTPLPVDSELWDSGCPGNWTENSDYAIGLTVLFDFPMNMHMSVACQIPV